MAPAAQAAGQAAGDGAPAVPGVGLSGGSPRWARAAGNAGVAGCAWPRGEGPAGGGPAAAGRVLGLSGRWARPALGWLGCCGSCAGARLTRDDPGRDGLSGSGGPARLVPVAGDGAGAWAGVLLPQCHLRTSAGDFWAVRCWLGRGVGAVAEQPGLSFAGLLRQLRAKAKLTQEELAEAAGVSPRSVSDLERGDQPHRPQGHRGAAGRCAGPGRPARELFVAVARGQAPTAQVLAAARGTFAGAIPGLRVVVAAWPAKASCLAAGGGDRFPLPRAGRVRGAGRGVVLRPRGGHRPGAGADVAARGGHGAADGVGGVGRGEVVAAAGGGVAADPGGGAGGRAGGGVVAVCCFHPDPGAAG